MNHDIPSRAPDSEHSLSRRTLFRRTAAAATLALLAGGLRLTNAAEAAPSTSPAPTTAGADLKPLDPIQTIFGAMERFPLVAIAEPHTLQEWHDFITALLFHPALPRGLTDVVVEFGCASYQDLADRFVLSDQPVAKPDLEQIWRQVGDPAWNAPVYEQFFRTVRAVNWMRPPERRIRVLLGQPPIGMNEVLAHPTNRSMVLEFVLSTSLEEHYAAVVEREVLRKGRRALLIAGGGHVLRGLHTEDDRRQLNAASRLVRRQPGTLFVVDTLVVPPGAQQDALGRRVQASTRHWPRPALAYLADTWLGATGLQPNTWINRGAERAVSATAARYDAQADAVLYLGPGEVLTASRPDPAIYHWGAYPQQLRRLSPIVGGAPDDLVDTGLRLAQAGPSWFA